MIYQGYTASIRYDETLGSFIGMVVNVQDTITFTGASVSELKQNLKECVDAYIAKCHELGKNPEKGFSGKFSVRTSPEIHQRAAITAAREGMSLNAWVGAVLDEKAEKMPG